MFPTNWNLQRHIEEKKLPKLRRCESWVSFAYWHPYGGVDKSLSTPHSNLASSCLAWMWAFSLPLVLALYSHWLQPNRTFSCLLWMWAFRFLIDFALYSHWPHSNITFSCLAWMWAFKLPLVLALHSQWLQQNLTFHVYFGCELLGFPSMLPCTRIDHIRI